MIYSQLVDYMSPTTLYGNQKQPFIILSHLLERMSFTHPLSFVEKNGMMPIYVCHTSNPYILTATRPTGFLQQKSTLPGGSFGMLCCNISSMACCSVYCFSILKGAARELLYPGAIPSQVHSMGLGLFTYIFAG